MTQLLWKHNWGSLKAQVVKHCSVTCQNLTVVFTEVQCSKMVHFISSTWKFPWFVCECVCNAYFLFYTESRCVGRACSPPMGNLASGRTLFTLTSCCTNSSSCLATQPRCLAELHPPALMADDPFIHPDTWWGSAAATGEKEEIRLDLETRFCMSHVVMLFRSPRPAAMRLERSQDFGQTWETLKLFARNCTEMFGLPDDVSQAGAVCTSRYSNAVPCSRGEVRKEIRSLKHYKTSFKCFSRFKCEVCHFCTQFCGDQSTNGRMYLWRNWADLTPGRMCFGSFNAFLMGN